MFAVVHVLDVQLRESASVGAVISSGSIARAVREPDGEAAGV
jgi:hypothetical protein